MWIRIYIIWDIDRSITSLHNWLWKMLPLWQKRYSDTLMILLLVMFQRKQQFARSLIALLKQCDIDRNTFNFSPIDVCMSQWLEQIVMDCVKMGQDVVQAVQSIIHNGSWVAYGQGYNFLLYFLNFLHYLHLSFSRHIVQSFIFLYTILHNFAP